MGVDKAGGDQAAGSVHHGNAFRRVHMSADGGNFAVVVNQQLAVLNFFANNGFQGSALNQKHMIRSFCYHLFGKH